MSSDVVVVTSRSFGSGDADPAGELRAAGLDVVKGDPGHEALPLEGAVGWIAGVGPITAAHLEAAPRLKVIARFGTGVDAVDLRAAADRDVVVARTPGANAESVADHAVALMLAALRDLVAADAAARRGDHDARRGRELGALTVGIVGLGAVGRGVARRVGAGFGARVVAHDPFASSPDVPLARLDEVAGEADVLTLHLPGGEAPLVDAPFLAAMKPGAVLINTARASLLDEHAVAEALRGGRLAAAAVDVHGDDSPLLSAPNVTVTPHIAAQTTQSIDRMGTQAAAEVLRVLRGDRPLNPVHPQESV
jgi:D-3-phosphoglycerate dehydrogenase